MNRPIPAVSRINYQVPRIASNILVALMLVCLTAAAIALIRRLIPGYQGTSLLLVTVFLTIESLVGVQTGARQNILSARSPLQRAAEWVAIIAFIKLITHLPSGFSTLVLEASRWRSDFLTSFFNPGYLAVVGYGFFIWLLAGVFGQWLFELEHDPDLLDMEREGYGLRDREAVRRNMIGLVFSLGGSMLLMTALLRLDLSASGLSLTPARQTVWYLIAYFVLGLGLLALTRFSALRSRWYIQKIPIRDKLGARWLGYALAFFAGIGLLALLLPTSYSVGLLNLIGGLISGLASIIAFLELLLFTPFLALISWVSQLFRGEPVSSNPLPTQQPIQPAPPAPAAPIPWLEILKSVLFWAVFLAVIFLSVRYYFSDRRQLFAGLGQIPFLNWLAGIWRSLRLLFSRAVAGAASQVSLGLRQLRRAPAPPRPRPRSTGSASTPREEVLAVYLEWLEQQEQTPLRRRPTDTPAEYAGRLSQQLPDSGSLINDVTEEFIAARYSQVEIQPDRPAWVRTLLRRLDQAFRSRMENGEHR